jgi:hypothetical protein
MPVESVDKVLSPACSVSDCLNCTDPAANCCECNCHLRLAAVSPSTDPKEAAEKLSDWSFLEVSHDGIVRPPADLFVAMMTLLNDRRDDFEAAVIGACKRKAGL